MSINTFDDDNGRIQAGRPRRSAVTRGCRRGRVTGSWAQLNVLFAAYSLAAPLRQIAHLSQGLIDDLSLNRRRPCPSWTKGPGTGLQGRPTVACAVH